MTSRLSSHVLGVLAAIATNALSLTLTVGASIIWARTLGVHGRGEFSAVQSWPVLLASFGTLGSPDALVYFVARNRSLTLTYLRFSALVSAVAVLALTAVVFFLVPVFLQAQSPAVIVAARIGLILAPLWVCIAVASAMFQGLQSHLAWNMLRVLQPAANFVAALLMLLVYRQEVSVQTATVLLIGTMTVAASVALYVLIRHLRSLGQSTGAFPKRPFLRYGLYSGAANGPRQLNIRFDQAVMPAFLAATALGYYAVGASWAYLGFGVVTAIGSASIAAIARNREAGGQRGLLVRTMFASLGLVLLIAAAVYRLAPWGLKTFFGSEYVPAVLVTRVLVLAAAISSLNGVWGDMLRGLGAPQKSLYGELLGLLITVPGLFYAIPRFGITGAAWVSVIAYAAVFAFQTYALITNERTLSMTPSKSREAVI